MTELTLTARPQDRWEAAVRERSGEACMRELTLPVLCRLAMRLDPTHRGEMLREYESLTAWVRSRMARGIAWALMVSGEPVVAVGIYTVGNAGYVWLAGARGWTRHIRKLVPFWAAVKSSGAYPRLLCDTFDGNAAERRWVEHLGFKEIGRSGDRTYYGMTI